MANVSPRSLAGPATSLTTAGPGVCGSQRTAGVGPGVPVEHTVRKASSLGLSVERLSPPWPPPPPVALGGRNSGYSTPALQCKQLEPPTGTNRALGWQLGQAPPTRLFSSQSLPEHGYFWLQMARGKGIKAAAGRPREEFPALPGPGALAQALPTVLLLSVPRAGQNPLPPKLPGGSPWTGLPLLAQLACCP